MEKQSKSTQKSAQKSAPAPVSPAPTEKPQRERWAIVSALLMQLFGTGLAVWGFATPPVGEVSESVLWFTAQALIYSGSIFGVSVYVQSKIAELRSELKD